MNTTEQAERLRRCRYLTRRLNRCPNPSLDQDPATPDICIKHAASIMALIAQHEAAFRGRGPGQ
jgi:hypothetical protein